MKRFITALLVALVSTAAFSQEPSATELEKQIRELREKISRIEAGLPSESLDEIRRQIEILSQEIEALKLHQDSKNVTASESLYGLGPAASKVYRSEPGFSIGGYGEMLYENFDDTRDNGVASGATDQLDFLRAILYVGYKFNDRVVFNSEIEVEHATTGDSVGEVSLEFGYLDFLIGPEFNVRAGMVLLPVGLINELHEPTAFLGARRPQLEQRVIPSTWRENGVGFFGDAGDFTYRAYVVNGLDAADFSSSGIRSGRQKGGRAKAEDFALTGRLDWQPREGVLLGGSFYTGASSQGESFDATLTLTELHSELRYRGAMFRALWAEGSIDDVAELNALIGLTGNGSVGETIGGWYAELGYDLTALRPMGEMSIIPYIRYEEFDTQKDVPTGFSRNPVNDVDIMTLGLAWKPIPQTVIKVDYQNVNNQAGTGVDQFNAALGYIF